MARFSVGAINNAKTGSEAAHGRGGEERGDGLVLSAPRVLLVADPGRQRVSQGSPEAQKYTHRRTSGSAGSAPGHHRKAGLTINESHTYVVSWCT